MENGVFQDSAVAEELTNFIEARLHVDGVGAVYEEQLALHQEMNETTARPYFVVLDPNTQQPVARFRRALVPGESPAIFIEFLRKARLDHAERSVDSGDRGAAQRREILEDDLGAALARAAVQDKLLLVNFTSYVGVSSRLMEKGVFEDSGVAQELANFVEARLHVDGVGGVHEELLALHRSMNGTRALPFFVVLDPDSEEPLARFRRALMPGEDPRVFIDFLRKARGV